MTDLPDQLRAADRFLTWKQGLKPNGKIMKLPFYVNGRARGGTKANPVPLDSPRDLAQLASYSDAFDAWLAEDDISGIGFALVGGDGIGAFDLDDCLDADGRLKREHPGFTIAAQAKLAGAYMEVSPSGNGLRIIGPCQISDAYSKGGLEFWGEKRFVTLTGEIYANPKGWVDLTTIRQGIEAPRKPRDDHSDDEAPIVTQRVLDELRDALQAIDADDRDLWIRMGMAMKTIDDHRGLPLWMEWSKRSPKFDYADADRVWDSLNPQQTSYKAVFAEAQANWDWVNPAKGKRSAKDAFANGETDEDEQSDAQVSAIPIAERLQPTEFILDGFLPVGVSVVAGAWGAGKSTNLIPLLCSAAHLAPQEWGFWPAIRRKVLWVTEAPEQAQDTLYSLMRADGAAPIEDFREWFLLYRAERIPAKKLARRLEDQIAELTYTLDNGFEVRPVIVLDTTSANIELENESDNSQVSAAMAILKQRLPGISLILVGHTPKALARSDVKDMTFRGAGAWEADAVATFFLIHDEELDMRFLALRKSRFGPDYREVSFDSDKGSLIIDTPWGEPQSKTYLHGIPKRSNGEERRQARQAFQEERTEQRKEQTLSHRQGLILEAITRGSGEGRMVGPTRLREEIGGKNELLAQALARLEEAGLVVAHDIPPDLMTRGRPGTFYLPEGVDVQLFLDRVKGNVNPS